MEYYITHRGKSQHIVVINSLSVWGLGGVHALAIAKARLWRAPTVCLQTNESI